MANSIWIPATIGAASAIGVSILRDFLLPRINDRRSRQQTEADLFSEYLNPIVLSLESLMWRFNEILNQQGRGVYLHREGSGSQYANYKRASTVYRLAVAIGWFRAFERELLNIRSINSDSRDQLRSSLKSFQSALADGKSVEIDKLERLANLFGFQERITDENRDFLAIRIENQLDHSLGANKHLGLESLPFENQRKFVEEILKLILDIDRLPLVQPIPNEAVLQAAKIMSYRQTWIYRDWQSAIGDAMLRETNAGPRKFGVMGFGEFEDYWNEPPRWLERISSLVLDFDVVNRDLNDARHEQLLGILTTVASLIVALLDNEKNLRGAMPATYAKARELSK